MYVIRKSKKNEKKMSLVRKIPLTGDMISGMEINKKFLLCGQIDSKIAVFNPDSLIL